jgi:hypothetical protein
MGSAFVFDPEASYGKVQQIRAATKMPVAGLRYVAAVTGPWKIFEVVEFDGLGELADRLDAVTGSNAGGSGDPPNALAIGTERVRRSHYKTHTALVRVDVRVDDPSTLFPDIAAALDVSEDELEADSVAGDFDILICVVEDDEEVLNQRIFALRQVNGVKRTVSLRVLDYVSTSDHADADHRVDPA